ncbi:HS6ST1 [Lepeophtheirus salmonis]|uniref:Heparan-sulfate 6-O-sulfotransferase n=1 Tax=Lepeophtheirus salmonis TaxID=72036 RepID=A0A7R8D073_LEPSM|nr:HS6ST1 [Lepeophtheirus salmonis]CAF2980514.1 HS6ST1 [Lepeophtheirus salmonis]
MEKGDEDDVSLEWVLNADNGKDKELVEQRGEKELLVLTSLRNESSSSPFTPHLNILPTPPNVIDFESTQRDNFIFHFNGSDVMIFLHIQKTGGTTFGKHLVQDINLESPPGGSNKTWLFSRYSTGWKCGLHADWTELTACVDPYLSKTEGPGTRRYFYITFLREPVSRYLSEFRHVQRGATWKDSKHTCNGRRATSIEIPPCYKPPEENWEDVSLRDFMDCSSNLAVNRMTRMLADLTLVNCYDKLSMSFRERDTILFESAKRNLEIMTFFGLTEEQIASQYLFQKIFNLNFKVNFTQYQRVQGDSTLEELSPEVLSRIEQLNHLDIKLYAYAKELMMKRYRAFKKTERRG